MTMTAETSARSAAQTAHERRVNEVCEQVRRRPPHKIIRIKKRGAHSIHASSDKSQAHLINVEGFNQILDIDPDGGAVTAECHVTIRQLCEYTLQYGLLPLVVPEFQDFTVGGLFAGEGIQTSAHRYGVFSSSVSEIEIVTATGETLYAAPSNEHADLFFAARGAFSTIGVITALRIRLRRADEYVVSRYYHVSDLEEYCRLLAQSKRSCEFLEGVVFGPEHYTVIVSDFAGRDDVERESLPVFEPLKRGEEWYYYYANRTRRRGVAKDAIPTIDFLFRSHRGLWWIAECYLDSQALAGSRWIREKVDDAAEAAMAENGFEDPWMTTEERERCLINQDLLVVEARIPDMIRYVQKHIQLYPIWTCLVDAAQIARADLSGFIADIGLYGEPMAKGYQAFNANYRLQKMCDLPAYWGNSYLTAEEWDQTYNLTAYDEARKKYQAEGAFLHVKDRVRFIHERGVKSGKIRAWRLLRVFRMLLGRSPLSRSAPRRGDECWEAP
ncbi:MAG TPA: FAD-binding oxidoreductase [Blastocatellia bacterium]|nr:FAD-binding oxidoreductase [Blastocatellia bacterium]